MNLAAYFQRIGYRGRFHPDLALLSALTQAHTQSIPFENLDVLLGLPISLEPEALFQKLVVDRRGGYCFEQNGLFLEVLRELGFQWPRSARGCGCSARAISFRRARTCSCAWSWTARAG